ncbi:hypothetical protein PSACC_03458 [Paramicrosporidium saccamoebae]|uniref:Secreted protein n=1 Tax=Paramicrosporidium saccamoebae TaxID=1246581 RepID=A0A2H9TFX8_9FUNG|nr:hypothetical protein PSACC_03458 [Paramicrosporidium saccamoebae]
MKYLVLLGLLLGISAAASASGTPSQGSEATDLLSQASTSSGSSESGEQFDSSEMPSNEESSGEELSGEDLKKKKKAPGSETKPFWRPYRIF